MQRPEILHIKTALGEQASRSLRTTIFNMDDLGEQTVTNKKTCTAMGARF